MAEVVIDIVGRDNFSGTLGNFGNIMTGIKSAIDLAGEAFRTFSGFAMEGLDAIAGYERMSATLETLVAKELLATGEFENMADALAAASPKAEELLGWIQELAIKSPFTAEGVANAFRTAQAYGFTADEAKRLTEAMINFAAGSGASEGVMNQIALALGQIEAKGKLAGQEVLQLVNAGLPVTQILAEAFGVTTAEIVKMQEDGLIPAHKAIEAITVYLETNFAGAAERQANTWAGLKGTFEDLKAMGLREFFGGLFDALQPLAIKFAEWMQTEGMEKLKEWGADLGALTDKFVRFVLILPGIISELRNADLSDITTALDRIVGNFVQGLADKVDEWVAGDGPEELSNKIIGWIDDIGTGPEFESKALTAAGNLLSALGQALADVDWGGITDSMDEALSRMIERQDWRASGDAFGQAVVNFITGGINSGVESAGSSAIPSIGAAISQWLLGAMDIQDWGEFPKAFMDSMVELWVLIVDGVVDIITGGDEQAEIERAARDRVFSWFKDIGSDVWQGLREGLTRIEWDATQWLREHLVNPIKRFLGIESPSTLFAEIGRNIILGLIGGISSMFSSLLIIGVTIATSFVNTVVDKFGEIKDRVSRIFDGIRQAWDDSGLSGVIEYLGGIIGDISGNVFGGTTGTTGGMTGDTGHGGRDGGGVLTGSAVTNNFYGPVYFGDMGQLGYDCPSPHPLMVASSQSLLTSGVG